MQEKEQKISPIKERILQFANSLGISKREFYKIINVSRGTLESKTGITEDIVSKFIASFPEISTDWLLKGEGDMYKNKITGNRNITNFIHISFSFSNIIKGNNNITTGSTVGGRIINITGETDYQKIIKENEIELTRQDKSSEETQQQINILKVEIESLKRELQSKDKIIESLINTLGKK